MQHKHSGDFRTICTSNLVVLIAPAWPAAESSSSAPTDATATDHGAAAAPKLIPAFFATLTVVGSQPRARSGRRGKSGGGGDGHDEDEASRYPPNSVWKQASEFHELIKRHVAVFCLLPSSTQFRVTVTSSDSTSEPTTPATLFSAVVKTEEAILADCDADRGVVTARHLSWGRQFIVHGVIPFPGDYMIAILAPSQPTAVPSTPFMSAAPFVIALLKDALFVLPQRHPQLLSLPNAKKRFVIDFRRVTHDWITSHKKVAKAVREAGGGLVLHIDSNFRECMQSAFDYHSAKEVGTWIRQDLVELFCRHHDEMNERARRATPSTAIDAVTDLQFHSFELRDSASGKLLAATLGYSMGRTFHDFTMCTLVRDARCLGHLVTRLAGKVLHDAGYELWYWGMRLGYMGEYDGALGGVEMERGEFYELWLRLRNEPPRIALVPAGAWPSRNVAQM